MTGAQNAVPVPVLRARLAGVSLQDLASCGVRGNCKLDNHTFAFILLRGPDTDRKTMQIPDRIEALLPQITALRQDLQCPYPEILFDCHRTSATVADFLRKIGCDAVENRYRAHGRRRG